MVITGKIPKKLKEAVDFFATELFTPQMKRHVEVRVRQRDLGTWHGFASIEDYNSLGQPRSFVIELHKNDNEAEKLKTLAHELVHVRQYVRNELNDEMNTWKGRKIDSDQYPMTTNHGKSKQTNLGMNSMNDTPTKPDEYFMPEPDNGSWYYQSQLEQQEQENG
jgi:hypothetical protein